MALPVAQETPREFGRLALLLVFRSPLPSPFGSPDTREITSPNPSYLLRHGAVAIPVDDLYTRSVGGGAWSPDGKQIVFSTNLTGRNNLWSHARAA
jgi:hypothetical protein